MTNLNPYLTPHKLGRPVLTGSGTPGTFDEQAVDVPFVFEHGGAYYMTLVGFDGKGYLTGLARADQARRLTLPLLLRLPPPPRKRPD